MPTWYSKPQTDSLLSGKASLAGLRATATRLSMQLRPAHSGAFVATTSDAPTYTVTTSRTLSGQRYTGPQTGEVTELGSRGVWNPSTSRLAASGLTGLGFYISGDRVEIGMIAGVNGTIPTWIFVDDVPVTLTPDTTTFTGASTSTGYLALLVFGSAKRRKIEFYAGHSAAWLDVAVPWTSMIEPLVRPPAIGWMGDSFLGGSNGSSGWESYAWYASRDLGCEGVVSGMGGTGYVAPGSFTPYTDSGRIASLTGANPSLIVFVGSVNDDSNASSVQAAAASAYAKVAAAAPNTPVIVFGSQPSAASTTVAATRAATIAAIKAAAVAAPNVIAFHDMVGTGSGVPVAWSSGSTYNEGDKVVFNGSVWRWRNGGTAGNANSPSISSKWELVTYGFTGTGQVGTTTGNGTRDVFLYSDSIHPTALGQQAFRTLIAAKVRSDLAAYAATGMQIVD